MYKYFIIIIIYKYFICLPACLVTINQQRTMNMQMFILQMFIIQIFILKCKK